MIDLNPSSVFVRVRPSLVAATLAFGSGLAAAAACGPGLDQDCDVDLIGSVVSTPTSVTLSTMALPTVISYTLMLTHYPNPELLKYIGFTVTTEVRDSSDVAVPGQLATFESYPGGCTPSGGGTVLTCSNLGSLTDAGSSASFSMTVKAPTAGHHVTIKNTSVSYSEDGNPVEVIPSTATAVTMLTAPSPLGVSTYVLPAGATFYTGTNGGLPTAAPQSTWAALVKVPASGGTTGNIANVIGDPGCPRAGNLLDCSNSQISLPNVSFPTNFLTFELRRDASTIVGNGKIANAIVYYDNPAHPDPRINYSGFGFQVPPCSSTTYGPLPQSGIPCIQERNAWFQYKNGTKAKDDGHGSSTGNDKNSKLLYWEFIIRAVDNGRFTN